MPRLGGSRGRLQYAPAWAPRAERAVDGGAVDISCALSGPPRAPRIPAQRVARFDPYNTRNCLPPKKLCERYSRGKHRLINALAAEINETGILVKTHRRAYP